jgi:hypothetical protein
VLATVTLASAALFLFAVVGIARIGASTQPSAPVVSAAREAVRERDASRLRELDGYPYRVAPDRAGPGRHPCQKHGKRSRVKS